MDEKESILIVDDDESTRKSLTLIFRKEGYEIEIAETGREAMEKAKQRFFNLVLLDIKLPDMEGVELLGPLKVMHPDMVLIMVTAYASVETAVKALNEGASSYITKPLNIDEVLVTIQGAIEKQRLVMENRRLYDEAQRELAERKRSEEKLKASEAKYQDLYDNASDMFVSVDAKTGKIIECNQTLATALGYKKEDIIGRHIFELYHPNCEKERKKVFSQFAKTGEVRNAELQLQRKDGTKIDVSLNISAMRDEQGKVLYSRSICRDITETKKLEAQLWQAQKMEAIGTLAGGIAHDFNNILTPLLVHTELALLDIPEKSPIRFHIQEALKAGHRARDLVKQILTFRRQSEQERKPFKIRIIVKETLKLLRASLPTTIEIIQNINAESDTILADPIRIQQVLMNLCTNAAHAMRGKVGVLEVSLEDVRLSSYDVSQFSHLSPGPYIRLTVRDTGHGIEHDVMGKIFDPYFTTKGVGEGTGMGLAVIHAIVMSHGGEIKVNSEPGKGTTFHIFFPKIEGEISSEAESVNLLPGGTERVLLVDDEKTTVDAVQPMLEHLGYKVTARTSSIEALEAFSAKPDRFDLIITDMTMPMMTGAELAKEIMQIQPGIPIILCTGFSEQVNEEKVKEIGIRAFIMKPLIMSEIPKTIRKVLDQRD